MYGPLCCATMSKDTNLRKGYPWYLLEFAAPNTELYLGQEVSAHFWGGCFLVWFFCFGL